MADSSENLKVRVALRSDGPKQERSLLTRSEILKAAREVFARDGFERARLEDIVASMGKTRGAFYAHFEDKEDVFFAIFEEDVAFGKRELASDLNRSFSKESRIEALVAHLTGAIKDRDRMRLNLEFKMYALRHPERRKRFNELQTALCLHGADPDFRVLLPEFAATTGRARTQMAQIGALIDGLALNRMFDPAGLNDEALDHQVRAGVRAILFAE